MVSISNCIEWYAAVAVVDMDRSWSRDHRQYGRDWARISGKIENHTIPDSLVRIQYSAVHTYISLIFHVTVKAVGTGDKAQQLQHSWDNSKRIYLIVAGLLGDQTTATNTRTRIYIVTCPDQYWELHDIIVGRGNYCLLGVSIDGCYGRPGWINNNRSKKTWPITRSIFQIIPSKILHCECSTEKPVSVRNLHQTTASSVSFALRSQTSCVRPLRMPWKVLD